MALSERRVLHSVKILFTGFAEFEWKDQVLRNGEVISEANHNGAYPIKADGSFDTEIVTLNGQTVADVIGPSADQAVQNAILLAESLNQEKEKALAINEALNAEKDRSSALSATLEDVQSQLALANARIAELEAPK